MSKTRNKSSSELEHLRGQVKKLRSENRLLKRRNKELERRSHYYEEIVDDVADEIIEKPDSCPECGKGDLIVKDLYHLVLTTCSLCEYTHRRKPRGKK